MERLSNPYMYIHALMTQLVMTMTVFAVELCLPSRGGRQTYAAI